MRNYIGFYAILAVLIFLLVFSNFIFNSFKKDVLDKVYELKDNEIVADNFNTVKQNFKKIQPILMTISNHSNLKEINKYLIRIENDINSGYKYNLKNDIDELILCIEEILNGEKCILSNIF